MRHPATPVGNRAAARSDLSERSMLRALGYLYICGATLAIAWTLLPHTPTAGDGWTRAMALTAIGLGLVLVSGLADGIGRLGLHLVLAAIQIVIAVAYVSGGQPDGDIRLFFIWATPYAAFYFPAVQAVAQFAWTALVLAVSLLLMPGGLTATSVGVFLMTIGTVLATGVLVAWAGRILRSAESRHRHQALHDPLTGLPNRLMFAQAARDALAEHRDRPGSVALALVDLDRFKVINDTYGHHTGDELLTIMADRLRDKVRPTDLVARMGGDEFAVLLVADDGRPVEFTPLVQRLAQAWADPIRLSDTTALTTGSIGVAVSSGASDTADSLLRDADIAMYLAKRSRPGSWLQFETTMRHGAT